MVLIKSESESAILVKGTDHPSINDGSSMVKQYGGLSSSLPSINTTPKDEQEKVDLIAEKSICRRVLQRLSTLTLEPALFLYMFAFIMRSTCSTNLMMEKACYFHLKYPDYICKNLTFYTDEKGEVEKMANNYNQYQSLIHMAPAAVVMIFIGPWSDKYGRKLPLIIAVALSAIDDIGLVLNAWYYQASLNYILLSAVPGGLGGGLICLFSTLYSMASELTTSGRERTIRYAFLELSLGLGTSMGALVAGQLYKYYNYLTVFTVGAIFHCAAVPWIVFFIKETRGFGVDVDWRKKFLDFFSFHMMKEGFKACIKRRENNGRCQLLLLLAATGVLVISYASFPTVAYVYVFHMFNWNPTTYANVNTVFSLVGIVVSVFCVPFFFRFFKGGDQMLGLVGSLSMMLKNLSFAFATQPWIYYLGNVLGLFSGTALLAVRASLSKLVSEDELGKVFCFSAICESLVPLVGTIAVVAIYNASVGFYAGLSYLVGAVVLTMPVVTFWWLICVTPKAAVKSENPTG